MGASTIIAQIILFIAVLGIASGLIVVIKNYSDQTEGVFKDKSNEYDQIIKTSIKIAVISYNNDTDTTWIYVSNTGQTSMKPSQVDVYIDGIRFPRNDTNRSIGVLSDTDIVNKGLWDPKEQLLIKAYRHLDDTKSHEVIVNTPYSVRDSDTFSI